MIPSIIQICIRFPPHMIAKAGEFIKTIAMVLDFWYYYRLRYLVSRQERIISAN
jgi:hypothetical protein